MGTLLDQGFGFGTTASMFDPNYKTPRSVQINAGIQREIRPGMIFSADFVRNVQTHYLLGIDENHTGDIHYFNKAGALAAINVTNSQFGCRPGHVPASSARSITVRPCPLMPATDSPPRPTSISPALQSSAPMAAPSRGINPNAPPLPFLKSVGRSVYNGLQAKLIENVKQPFRGVRALNFQVAYSLSRFENTGGGAADNPAASDQDFIINALDNVNAQPLLWTFGAGSNSSDLDRRLRRFAGRIPSQHDLAFLEPARGLSGRSEYEPRSGRNLSY